LSPCPFIELHRDGDHRDNTTPEQFATDAGFSQALSTRLGLAFLPPIGMKCFNGNGTLEVKS
jgi:hypothetical protein